MAAVILVYNGLHFPAGMLDKGLAWSVKNGGDMIALFIVSDKEQDEGYPFPNDLDEAEDITSDTDAVGKDLAIIASNIRLIRHQAKSAAVALQTKILPAPPQRELQTWLDKANLVLVSQEPLDPPVLSIPFPQLQKLLADAEALVEWVG